MDTTPAVPKPKREVLSSEDKDFEQPFTSKQLSDKGDLADDPAMILLKELARLELEGKEPEDFQEPQEVPNEDVAEIMEFEPNDTGFVKDSSTAFYGNPPNEQNFPLAATSNHSENQAFSLQSPNQRLVQPHVKEQANTIHVVERLVPGIVNLANSTTVVTTTITNTTTTTTTAPSTTITSRTNTTNTTTPSTTEPVNAPKMSLFKQRMQKKQ